MRRFLTAGWLLRHFVAIALVVAFLWLGWWQAERAGAGNFSSYAYAVEWPVFAGFVVFMWIREVRLNLRGAPHEPTADDSATDDSATSFAPEPVPAVATVGAGVGAAAAGEEDDDLAAYNRMLAWVNASPGRRFIDYPG